MEIGARYLDLNSRVEKMFADWSANAPPRDIYVRGDMTRMRFLQLLHLELRTHRSQEQSLDIFRKNLDRFEELAQVLFWQAVRECYPDNPLLKKRPWINAWKIGLDPEKWESEGLFRPETKPRPLAFISRNLTGIFAPQSLGDRLIYDLPFYMSHWHRGFLHYRATPFMVRKFIANKPALWLRWLVNNDYPRQAA